MTGAFSSGGANLIPRGLTRLAMANAESLHPVNDSPPLPSHKIQLQRDPSENRLTTSEIQREMFSVLNLSLPKSSAKCFMLSYYLEFMGSRLSQRSSCGVRVVANHWRTILPTARPRTEEPSQRPLHRFGDGDSADGSRAACFCESKCSGIYHFLCKNHKMLDSLTPLA